MALIQSPWALDQLAIYRPQTAGAVHAQKFFFDMENVSFYANDILELGVLASFAHIVDAQIVPVGSFTGTVDIGLMSGKPGALVNDDDTPRTVGNELFAAAATTGMLRLQKPDALLIPSTDIQRSIGVKFSSAVGPAAGKKFGLILWITQ